VMQHNRSYDICGRLVFRRNARGTNPHKFICQLPKGHYFDCKSARALRLERQAVTTHMGK
jgi:hypothetical protein